MSVRIKLTGVLDGKSEIKFNQEMRRAMREVKGNIYFVLIAYEFKV